MKRIEKKYDPKIESLLDKFTSSREELLGYLKDVDSLRSKISQIFPQTIDYRTKFVLEEKLKTMSTFFTTLLNIRQEYNRTLKDEISLRQKITDDDNQDPKEINLREIADEVDKIQKEKEIKISHENIKKEEGK